MDITEVCLFESKLTQIGLMPNAANKFENSLITSVLLKKVFTEVWADISIYVL